MKVELLDKIADLRFQITRGCGGWSIKKLHWQMDRGLEQEYDFLNNKASLDMSDYRLQVQRFKKHRSLARTATGSYMLAIELESSYIPKHRTGNIEIANVRKMSTTAYLTFLYTMTSGKSKMLGACSAIS